MISSVVDWSSRFLPEDKTGCSACYLQLRRVLIQDVDSYFRRCALEKFNDNLDFFMKLDIFCACDGSVSMVRML